MTASESWYRDNFIRHARLCSPDNWFLNGAALPSGGSDYGGRARIEADLVEIDPAGRMHLWLFASAYSPDLLSGTIIGRLFACAHAARQIPPAVLRARLQPQARRPLPPRLRPGFDSWNVVVVGGSGCELAGRDDNPLHRLYAPLSASIDLVGDVNIWQFYRTSTGFDLRCLWDVAAFSRPTLAEILARRLPMPAPGDDFDIACKRDLHLKRRKGFHAEGLAAWTGDHVQALAG